MTPKLEKIFRKKLTRTGERTVNRTWNLLDNLLNNPLNIRYDEQTGLWLYHHFIIKIKHPNSTGNVRELLLFFRISFFECVLLNVRA